MAGVKKAKFAKQAGSPEASRLPDYRIYDPTPADRWMLPPSGVRLAFSSHTTLSADRGDTSSGKRLDLICPAISFSIA